MGHLSAFGEFIYCGCFAVGFIVFALVVFAIESEAKLKQVAVKFLSKDGFLKYVFWGIFK